MQSVFKLPLALTVFQQIQRGRLSLDQPVRFLPSDRILPHVYSPLQSKYPRANVNIPLRQLLRLSVSLSDNTASDILLRLIGGPAAVNAYMESLGVTGFHLQDNENALHHNVAAQYDNWIEPAAAVKLLRRLADDPPLSPANTALLFNWMQPTGLTNRLQADLPEGVRIAHKSGTSDVDNGIAHATNDIGLITLPSGQQLAIAIFITDSTADQQARENVIAQIARATYDAGIRAQSSPRRTPSHTR
jgi:beta-lactamase class A